MLAQLAAGGAAAAARWCSTSAQRACARCCRSSAASESDVVACTAQEGIELAVRGELALYATDEALALDRDNAGDRGPRSTVH